MSAGVFVTGTDTGVGKTLISAALVHGLARQGRKVAGLKPVASGCERRGSELWSEDVALLEAASNVRLPPALINQYRFEPPLAPQFAAQQAGREIALAPIVEAVQAAARQLDFTLVEGVGGFCVPLNAREDTTDLACALGLPVVLVVGLRLGCINHALLTAEAIRARGLTLAGWVANLIDPHMLAIEANVAALTERLAAPRLGMTPHFPAPDFRRAADFLQADWLLAPPR